MNTSGAKSLNLNIDHCMNFKKFILWKIKNSVNLSNLHVGAYFFMIFFYQDIVVIYTYQIILLMISHVVPKF